jgi:hypothetical protein
MSALLRAVVAAWLSWVAPLAAAEGLYGYVDGAGVAHFADHAVDSRYAPVLRSQGDEEGRVLGKTMSRRSLLTWMEFAPEVKALQPTLREAARATGVDAELLMSLIAVESGFRADTVSMQGAIGLMQLLPSAVQRYDAPAPPGAPPLAERLLDPRTNVMLGARMLADLTRRFGRPDLALAAWNAGAGSVRRAGTQMPDIAETRAHVQLVLELYWALLQQREQRRALTAPGVSAVRTAR